MYNPNSINALFTLYKCFHNSLKNDHVFSTAELEVMVKVLSCKTHKLGGKAYGCINTQCSHEKRVCNTGKSKLFTSCGQKATESWIAIINTILPDCKYRSIIFTMPKAFWMILSI